MSLLMFGSCLVRWTAGSIILIGPWVMMFGGNRHLFFFYYFYSLLDWTWTRWAYKVSDST